MEMRLQSSITQREILNKTKIKTVEELMYADLRRVGWDKADAFYAAFRHLYSAYPLSQQKKLMSQLESDQHIKARIAGAEEGKNKISGEELSMETSKEKILSDLIVARKSMKLGSKEWGEYTKMIADYSKIKQDDIKTDDRPIRYFLPVRYPRSCSECLIYQNKTRKKLEETK